MAIQITGTRNWAQPFPNVPLLTGPQAHHPLVRTAPQLVPPPAPATANRIEDDNTVPQWIAPTAPTRIQDDNNESENDFPASDHTVPNSNVKDPLYSEKFVSQLPSDEFKVLAIKVMHCAASVITRLHIIGRPLSKKDLREIDHTVRIRHWRHLNCQQQVLTCFNMLVAAIKVNPDILYKKLMNPENWKNQSLYLNTAKNYKNFKYFQNIMFDHDITLNSISID